MEGLVTIADAVENNRTATHLLNEKVDVPMMCVVEREAQTESEKQTFTFEIDNGLKVSGSESATQCDSNWSITLNHTPEGTHITVRCSSAARCRI